eukprot:4478849-Prymnesium_polylepis.2
MVPALAESVHTMSPCGVRDERHDRTARRRARAPCHLNPKRKVPQAHQLAAAPTRQGRRAAPVDSRVVRAPWRHRRGRGGRCRRRCRCVSAVSRSKITPTRRRVLVVDRGAAQEVDDVGLTSEDGIFTLPAAARSLSAPAGRRTFISSPRSRTATR